jgi:hypothetical protein
VAVVLLQLALEALEQGEGIRGGSGEAGDHLFLEQAPHFAGVALHHRIAEGHLAVATDDHLAVAPYREDSRAFEGFHSPLLPVCA